MKSYQISDFDYAYFSLKTVKDSTICIDDVSSTPRLASPSLHLDLHSAHNDGVERENNR